MRLPSLVFSLVLVQLLSFSESFARADLDEIKEVVKELWEVQTKGGEAHTARAFHAKGICASATFKPVGGLPNELKVGLLKEGQERKGYVRFSNGSGMPGDSDRRLDVHALAATISGVGGPKLAVTGDPATFSQDFIATNYPLFIADEESFLPILRSLVEGAKGDKLALLKVVKKYPTTRNIVTTNTALKPSSFFETRYWSQGTYRFGNVHSKFSFEPCDGKLSFNFSPLKERNYLTSDFETRLTQGKSDICYQMSVQMNRDLDGARPEDPRIREATVWWPEPGYFTLHRFITPHGGVVLPELLKISDLKNMLEGMAKDSDMGELFEESDLTLVKRVLDKLEDKGDSFLKTLLSTLADKPEKEYPFRKVMEVQIHGKDVALINQKNGLCENLRIQPNHTTTDIVPEGFTGEVRRVVYPDRSKARLTANRVKPFQPTGDVAKDLKLLEENRVN